MDKALKAVLDWWEVSGVDVPEIKPAPRAKQSPAKPALKTVSVAVKKPEPPATPPSSEIAVKPIKTLEQLRDLLTHFDAGLLSDHAKQAVISRGNPEADIMIIGEAPGRDEDIKGQPFVGRSGQLLDKIFASIGLTEEALYITNVVNWRPPKNRNPNASEIALCLPLIHKHIELIDPKLIIMVGGLSLSALTGESGIMRQRGQWKTLTVAGKDYPALPVYHPAFLLRQPALKKDMWRDMLALRERIT